MIDYIKKSIQDSISVKENILNDNTILTTIDSVAKEIYSSVTSGGRVLICGNGGSAADSQHIAAELVVRFVRERRALAAIALTTDSSILTAIGNDYGFNDVFSRQVEALAQKGDIFIGISTSGNSANVIEALCQARAMGITTVGLLGGDGGECKKYCDHTITIDSKITARIQEGHILCGHIICGIIDETIASQKGEKAIFMDRDGTINFDSGYVYKIEDLKLIDGTIEALKLLTDGGYKLFIVTNQSGIGRNYFTHEQYIKFNNELIAQLNSHGINIEETLMCPHTPEIGCKCRKPSSYLIDKACHRYNIDRSKSFMLGDKPSDVECGVNSGIDSFLVTEKENLLYWANKIINERI